MDLSEYSVEPKEMTDIFSIDIHPKITINNVENKLHVSPFEEDIFKKLINFEEYSNSFSKLFNQ